MSFQRFFRHFLGILLFSLSIACTNNDIRQGTATPTMPDTLATEPLEPVNSVNTWEANPVIIKVQASPGFSDTDMLAPDLVVYADGRVVGTTWVNSALGTIPTYWSGQISSSKICNLLVQIEGFGFFDRSDGVYKAPEITDSGTTHITVNGWRVRSTSAYALGYAVNNPWKMGDDLPPSLADTYELLSAFQPPIVVPYQPERISLSIWPLDEGFSGELWPLTEPKLSTLTDGLEFYESGKFLLEGSQAAELNASFHGEETKWFKEDDKLYEVTLRPLFPLEIWNESNNNTTISQFTSSPRVEMTCSSQLTAVSTAIPTPRSTTQVAQISPHNLANKRAPLEWIFSIGERNAPTQLNFAGGIVGTPQGNLLVADNGNDRYLIFNPDGDLLEVIPNPDIKPKGMAYSATGNLFAMDWIPNVVRVYSPEMELLQTYGGWPAPDGGYDDPSEHENLLAVGPDDKIYLATTTGDRIVILNPDGSFLEEWHGPENEPLQDIWDIGTDAAGNLFIISRDQDRIVKRMPDGRTQEFFFNFGTYIAVRPDGSFYALSNDLVDTISFFNSDGNKLAQWQDGSIDTHGMAVGADGSVFLLGDTLGELSEHALVRYDEQGTLLASFGTTNLQPGQFEVHVAFSVSTLGDIWVVGVVSRQAGDTPDIQLLHIGGGNELLNSFETIGGQSFTCYEYSLAALSNQSVLVGDHCEGTITLVDKNGKIVEQWGEPGVESGQINLIADLTLAPDEQSVYLVDSGNGRISQFSLDGQLLAEWNNEQLEIQKPTSLAVASDGTFFVADGISGGIVVRALQGTSRRWPMPVSDQLPNDIAIDETRRRIYIGSTSVDLYAYDWEGNYLGRFTISDSNHVMVNVGPDGYVYRSGGFQKIQVLKPLD